jgi:DNA-binding MarR family transcriptional regulator
MVLLCGGKTNVNPLLNSGEQMAVNNPIAGLNKIFDNRVRLGVMSSVMVNNEISFNDLKQLLEVTDGNLATHLQTLEEAGFLKVHKGFVGRKTNTTYSITKAGEKAFKDHLQALENMIKGVR